jgi:MSHA biogenesis protein MshQ
MKKLIKLSFLIWLFVNASAFAATRTVCATGATYGTIVAAIAAAGNGDEIVICPGTYSESLTVSKANLTFRSSTGNRSDVKLTSSDSVFRLAAVNATIRNLTIISSGNQDAIVNDYNNGIGSHTFENLAITAKGTGIYLQTGGPHVFRKLDIISTADAGGGISIGYNADTAHVFDTVTVTSAGMGIVATRGAASMKNITVTSSNDVGISLSSKYSTLFETVKVSAKNDGLVVTTQDLSSALTFVDIEASSQTGAAVNIRRGIASMTRVKVSSGNAGIVLFGASLLKDIDTRATGIALDIGSQSAVNLTGAIAKSTADKAILLRDNGGGEYNHTLKNITIIGAGDDGLRVEKSAQLNAENICVQSAAANGVRFEYNAKKVTLKNSIFKGHGSYGVSMLSNPESISHVNNSCFYKAPCAEGSWSASVRDFSGNFTAPANCNNGANVNFAAPVLASCPLVENNCYVALPPDTAAPGSFNAFESLTTAGAVSGVIKTKIAGTQITLDVVALNVARDALANNFAGVVSVELVESSANCASSAVLTGTTASTLDFNAANNGRKGITLPAVANAYRDVRVRISYPSTAPTTVACSTDNFAIRPARFAAISARDANWETAGTSRLLANTSPTSGNVHKAGQPFTLQATAVNAAGVVTGNYVGSPAASATCSLPSPSCANGDLTTGTWNVSNGLLSTSTARYAEVGSFALTLKDEAFASVDIKAGDSSPAEYTIPSDSVAVGRFVPDHFALTPQGTAPMFRTFNATCANPRSFTYIGQPFLYASPPVVLITAKNAAQATTYNYRGNLWNLGGENVTQDYTANANRDGDLINTPLVMADSAMPGTGSILISSADQFKFLRNMLTPQAAFNANISLSVSVREVVPGHGDIESNAPAVFNGSGSGIAFDQGNLFRYGRMRIENASGSELLDMSLPLKTEYWNGSNFVLNTADNCTNISAANAALGPYRGAISSANLPVSNIANGNPILQGVGSIVLRKPIPAPAAKGSVDICIDLGADVAPASCTAISSASQPWLQGKWSQINYDDDPAARASFGTYRSGPIIYMREMY